jgi:hypothetical protein
MWQIKDSSINTVIATLKGQMGSTANYLLVTLTSKQTGESKSFIPLSWVQDDRKDVLTFAIGASDVPASGLISLDTVQFPAGWYTYTVREQSNNTNLDPDSVFVIKELECGVAYYVVGGVAFGETTFEAYTNNEQGHTYYTG